MLSTSASGLGCGAGSQNPRTLLLSLLGCETGVAGFDGGRTCSLGDAGSVGAWVSSWARSPARMRAVRSRTSARDVFFDMPLFTFGRAAPLLTRGDTGLLG